uniref:DUF4062 domain-containing protein n=2 Tax=Guillardia theta TaxID=55529 RepID=A0A7S4H994_GUITH
MKLMLSQVLEQSSDSQLMIFYLEGEGGEGKTSVVSSVVRNILRSDHGQKPVHTIFAFRRPGLDLVQVIDYVLFDACCLVCNDGARTDEMIRRLDELVRIVREKASAEEGAAGLEAVGVQKTSNGVQETGILEEQEEELAQRLFAFFKESYQQVPPHWKWILDVRGKDKVLYQDLQQVLLGGTASQPLPRLLVMIESLGSTDVSALLGPSNRLGSSVGSQVEKLRLVCSLLPGSCIVTSGPILSFHELTATCEGIELSVTRMDKLSVKERLHMLRANVAEALPDGSIPPSLRSAMSSLSKIANNQEMYFSPLYLKTTLFVLFQDSKLSVPDDFPSDLEGVVDYVINLSADRFGEHVTFDVLHQLSLGKSPADVFRSFRWSAAEPSVSKKVRACLELLRPLLFPFVFDVNDSFLDEGEAMLHGIKNRHVLNKVRTMVHVHTLNKSLWHEDSSSSLWLTDICAPGLDMLLGDSGEDGGHRASGKQQEPSNRRAFLPSFSVERVTCCDVFLTCVLEEAVAKDVHCLELESAEMTEKVVRRREKIETTDRRDRSTFNIAIPVLSSTTCVCKLRAVLSDERGETIVSCWRTVITTSRPKPPKPQFLSKEVKQNVVILRWEKRIDGEEQDTFKGKEEFLLTARGKAIKSMRQSSSWKRMSEYEELYRGTAKGVTILNLEENAALLLQLALVRDGFVSEFERVKLETKMTSQNIRKRARESIYKFIKALKTRDNLMLENELSTANMSANKALEQSLQHDTFKVYFNVPDKHLVDLAVRQLKMKNFEKMLELFNNPVVLHRLLDHMGVDSFCDEFLSSILQLGRSQVPQELYKLCSLLQEMATTHRADLRVGQVSICQLIAQKLPQAQLDVIERRATEMMEEMRGECAACADKSGEEFSLVRVYDCILRLEMMDKCDVEKLESGEGERLPLKKLLSRMRRVDRDVDSAQKLKEMKRMLVEPRMKNVDEFDRVSSTISRAQSIHALKSKQVAEIASLLQMGVMKQDAIDKTHVFLEFDLAVFDEAESKGPQQLVEETTKTMMDMCEEVGREQEVAISRESVIIRVVQLEAVDLVAQGVVNPIHEASMKSVDHKKIFARVELSLSLMERVRRMETGEKKMINLRLVAEEICKRLQERKQGLLPYLSRSKVIQDMSTFLVVAMVCSMKNSLQSEEEFKQRIFEEVARALNLDSKQVVLTKLNHRRTYAILELFIDETIITTLQDTITKKLMDSSKCPQLSQVLMSASLVRSFLQPFLPGERVQIKVFNSSTFSDMHCERDYLNNFIYPAFREACSRRRIDFSWIDFRWGGVTEDDSKENKTILSCLKKIDECTLPLHNGVQVPLVVGLLGERCGWNPPPKGKDRTVAGKSYKWTMDGKYQQYSVTGLEMAHAFFRRPFASETFFFLRDPEFTSRIEWKENVPQSASEAFFDNVKEGEFNVNHLKEDVKQIAAGRCYTYSPDLIDPPYEFRTFSIVSMIDSLRNKLKECAAEEVERQKEEILKWWRLLVEQYSRPNRDIIMEERTDGNINQEQILRRLEELVEDEELKRFDEEAKGDKMKHANVSASGVRLDLKNLGWAVMIGLQDMLEAYFPPPLSFPFDNHFKEHKEQEAFLEDMTIVFEMPKGGSRERVMQGVSDWLSGALSSSTTADVLFLRGDAHSGRTSFLCNFLQKRLNILGTSSAPSDFLSPSSPTGARSVNLVTFYFKMTDTSFEHVLRYLGMEILIQLQGREALKRKEAAQTTFKWFKTVLIDVLRSGYTLLLVVDGLGSAQVELLCQFFELASTSKREQEEEQEGGGRGPEGKLILIAASDVSKAQIPEISLPLLDNGEESDKVCRAWLRHFGKENVSPAQVKLIVSKEDGRSPLFLALFCAQASQLSLYEKVDEDLRAMSGKVDDLWTDCILPNMEQRFDRKVVKFVMLQILSSSGGISINDLKFISSSDELFFKDSIADVNVETRIEQLVDVLQMFLRPSSRQGREGLLLIRSKLLVTGVMRMYAPAALKHDQELEEIHRLRDEMSRMRMSFRAIPDEDRGVQEEEENKVPIKQVSWTFDKAYRKEGMQIRGDGRTVELTQLDGSVLISPSASKEEVSFLEINCAKVKSDIRIGVFLFDGGNFPQSSKELSDTEHGFLYSVNNMSIRNKEQDCADWKGASGKVKVKAYPDTVGVFLLPTQRMMTVVLNKETYLPPYKLPELKGREWRSRPHALCSPSLPPLPFRHITHPSSSFPPPLVLPPSLPLSIRPSSAHPPSLLLLPLPPPPRSSPTPVNSTTMCCAVMQLLQVRVGTCGKGRRFNSSSYHRQQTHFYQPGTHR